MTRSIATLLLAFALFQAADAQDKPKAMSVIEAFRQAAVERDFETMRTLFADTLSMVHVMGSRFTQKITGNGFVGGLERNADRTVEVLDQMTAGPFVFEHYRITNGADTTNTVFTYEIHDGRIVNMWHFDPPSVEAEHAKGDLKTP